MAVDNIMCSPPKKRSKIFDEEAIIMGNELTDVYRFPMNYRFHVNKLIQLDNKCITKLTMITCMYACMYDM